jgi:hypothetical protein
VTIIDIVMLALLAHIVLGLVALGWSLTRDSRTSEIRASGPTSYFFKKYGETLVVVSCALLAAANAIATFYTITYKGVPGLVLALTVAFASLIGGYLLGIFLNLLLHGWRYDSGFKRAGKFILIVLTFAYLACWTIGAYSPAFRAHIESFFLMRIGT